MAGLIVIKRGSEIHRHEDTINLSFPLKYTSRLKAKIRQLNVGLPPWEPWFDPGSGQVDLL
jgi:hypothetical protein